MGYFNGVIIRYPLLKPFLSDASIFVLAYFYGLTGKKKALINRAMLFMFYLMREKRSFKDSLIVGWVNI
ncbi:hypothetical protein CTR19_000549 [Salmonella enterica subsp. diarizonae]|nr:hypothetical protein [Salmonella enterica]EDR6491908.1 hypothetical protein [Salmonella enterica subsp. diarizonae]